MRLVYCRKCEDAVNLRFTPRACACMSCGGFYVDRLNSFVWGPEDALLVLGILNPSLRRAVHAQLKWGDLDEKDEGGATKARTWIGVVTPSDQPSVHRFKTKEEAENTPPHAVALKAIEREPGGRNRRAPHERKVLTSEEDGRDPARGTETENGGEQHERRD